MRWLIGGVLGLVAACAGPEPRAVEPEPGGERPLNVAFLMVDGVYNTELMAPWDVFQHTIFHTRPGMRVFTVSPSLEPVVTFEGLRILPDYTYDDAPEVDVLVVASAEHSMDSDLEDERMMAWVREAGRQADWLVSLCDGAFVLAEAGLLEGLESTTFPSDVAAYRERFPGLVVHEGVSFVHDGNAITSAGGALSYDAAMYLCELLYGEQVTRGIGRGICIDWDVDGIAHVRGPAAER